MTIHIREATPSDGALIHRFIVELAEYEKAVEEVQSTPDILSLQLAEAIPSFRCLIASIEDEPVGFALFFYSYSTWRAKRGVWLEDLYVRADFRGQGVGSRLFDAVQLEAIQHHAGRLEWPVLEWNTDAHDFYRKKGAQPLSDWRTWRISL